MAEEKTAEQSTDTTDREAEEDDGDLDLADLVVDVVTLLCGKRLNGPPSAEIRYKRQEEMLSMSIHMKSPDDSGAVIGRDGKTIQALRHIVRCIGGARHSYFSVDMAEENSRPPRPKDSPA